jgi:hypothetical protein
MLAGDALRLSVHERLADGRLFLAGGRLVVLQGTGRPCTVCGGAITKDSTEWNEKGSGDRSALAHTECYKLWWEESRRLPRPSLGRR